MRTILYKIFIDNWPRKVISIILAMITWIVVNHSLTATKTFADIPVKITNLPLGQTIEGLQKNGNLNKTITLTLTGNKHVLEELTVGDLEVQMDAVGKGDEWIAVITKKNLYCFNPDIDIQAGIQKIVHQDFIIKMCKLVTERIPIVVTQPIGEAPKGFQYLDIWPYQLSITVSGPEETVKQLKAKGLKLTFNLNDISLDDLTRLQGSQGNGEKDEISFPIPSSWKKISIPAISPNPMKINDPLAQALRIDFVQTNLVPINRPISITPFFPIKYSDTLNPNTYSIATNDFIKEKNGLPMITEPLFAQETSRLFIDLVRDNIQIVIMVVPKNEKQYLLWNAQFISPHNLEDLYVAKVLSSSAGEDVMTIQPHLREDYLRNRFRNYMNRFRIFRDPHHKLHMKVELKDRKIEISPTDNAPTG